MRRGRLFMLLYLLGWMVVQPGFADIDPAEYQLKSSVRSEIERQQLQAEFEADKQRQVQLQRQEEESAAQRQAAEKAAFEALPYPVRLTRTRCTVCHAADNYVSQRHNRIGWELVILRMQHLNDAPLATGERSVIAVHFAATYPARRRIISTASACCRCFCRCGRRSARMCCSPGASRQRMAKRPCKK